MPVFSIDVHEAGGALLFGTSTRADDLGRERLDGPATVALTLPHLPLQEGRFAVSVAVRSHDESEIYHHVEAACEFSVFSQSPGVGPVRVEGSWTLGGDRRSAPGGAPGQPQVRAQWCTA